MDSYLKVVAFSQEHPKQEMSIPNILISNFPWQKFCQFLYSNISSLKVGSIILLACLTLVVA